VISLSEKGSDPFLGGLLTGWVGFDGHVFA
jgi:hypothetical protein